MYLLLLGLVLAVGPGQRLPEFALLDPQGKLVTPATMKKPAVIVFWASWCPVCREEFPGLHRVAEETRVPFYVISREPKDTKEVVLAYMKAYPLFIPLLASDKDKPPEVANRFKVLGQPWSSPFYSLLSPQGSEQVGKALQVRVLPPHLLQGGTPSARYPGSQP